MPTLQLDPHETLKATSADIRQQHCHDAPNGNRIKAPAHFASTRPLWFQRFLGSGNRPMSRETFLEEGSPSGDSLRDMEPRPTPSENESSGCPNTETVLISSNSETATKLCGVWSRIPAWFWTQELEEYEEVSVELQPFKGMRAEARNGCGLCKILCLRDYTVVEDGLQEVAIDTLLELGTGKLVKSRVGDYRIWGRFKEAKAWLGAVYPFPSSWRPRSLAAADENSDLMLIQDWINNCQLNHTSCNNVTKDFLPTRLLDVEAFNNGRSPGLKDDVKLVRSVSYQIQKGGSAPQYITLSHCWGPPEKRPITTTLANLAARMGRIAFTDLPRTFQDAVVLTRKLGQRYLWIDSLCIIQDDEDDWANEASMMAKVYAQSYCTLAGLSSSDSTEGLRMSGNGRTDKSLIIDLSANDAHNGLFNARIFSQEPARWQEEYDGWSKPANHFGTNGHKKESPLRYRAWALQEKELSTRSIHFGFKQLLWECRELKGTSELPWYHIMRLVERDELDREREWAKSHPEGSILFYRMSASWLNLSQDYSDRSLTKETDKLPALSGIAQSFQKYFPNDKYIAGIWTCHLPLALLWKPLTVATERYTTEYIAPSWSWTSHPSAIMYDYFDYQEIFW